MNSLTHGVGGEALNSTNAKTFDRMRGMIDGTPGFQKASTTVNSVIPLAGFVSTYVVETIRTDEMWAGFIQAITEDGTIRMYLPESVMKTLWRQKDQVITKGRKSRGKRQAEERKAEGFVPFQKGKGKRKNMVSLHDATLDQVIDSVLASQELGQED